jgi:putative acetyltransferase
MIVRRELASDHDAVRALVAAVYSPDLIDGLRASDAWLPELSFVALGTNGEIVGYVAATRGRVGSAPTLVLLPPSIEPDQRGRGVGQALMHTILGAADALGEALVGVVAYPPEYYSRFGFHPGDEYAIAAPIADWQSNFLVRPLAAYRDSIRGAFSFPDPFLAT